MAKDVHRSINILDTLMQSCRKRAQFLSALTLTLKFLSGAQLN